MHIGWLGGPATPGGRSAFIHPFHQARRKADLERDCLAVTLYQITVREDLAQLLGVIFPVRASAGPIGLWGKRNIHRHCSASSFRFKSILSLARIMAVGNPACRQMRIISKG